MPQNQQASAEKLKRRKICTADWRCKARRRHQSSNVNINPNTNLAMVVVVVVDHVRLYRDAPNYFCHVPEEMISPSTRMTKDSRHEQTSVDLKFSDFSPSGKPYH